MKKYRKVIFGRIIFTVMLVLLQVFWFIVFFLRLFEIYPYVSIAINILAAVFVVYTINSEHEPVEYKIGWIIIVLVFPFIGVPYYILFGDKTPSRKLRRKMEFASDKFKKYKIQDEEMINKLANENHRISATSRYLWNDGAFPVFENTAVKYFSDSSYMFESIKEELQKAEKFIFLEMFTIEIGEMWNPILDIIVEKAKAGVEVRILYDDMGCLLYLPRKYNEYLESLSPNIKCMKFNHVIPVFSLIMNNRDHRKIFVIDGKVAFTGGTNLSDRYININSPYGYWKDTGIKLTGEGVWGFTTIFLEMWNTVKFEDEDILKYRSDEFPPEAYQNQGYVQPYCDAPIDDKPLAENVYAEILNQAKNYVYIFTPYLILSEELKRSIIVAALRGVDIRIVTPGIPDKKIAYRITRSNYKALMRAGVKIYEFTPGFIHSKSIVCDDKIGIVGTINMDYRSLYLHFECAALFYNKRAVYELKEDAFKTMEISREVKPEDVKTGFWGGLFNSVLKVFAPLF